MLALDSVALDTPLVGASCRVSPVTIMLVHCLGYRPTQFADTSKRKRPDPKAQPKSLDVPQGEKEHRKMYGITLHLDHLEASKLFLLSWILRWKPDLAKIFGDNSKVPFQVVSLPLNSGNNWPY